MAIVSLKSFEQILQEMIFIIQASTDKITDFNIGSVTRAYLECIALLGQYIGSKLENIEEAFYINTAENDDLDNRGGDFGVPRTQGTKSTGLLYFYSYSVPASPITILAGTIVNTLKDVDGNFIQYKTINDIILSSSNVGVTPLEAYSYITSGTGECLITGVAGNINANRIIELQSEIAGVSGVVNIDAMTGGVDTESDEEYRKRIKLYLQSLAKGTKTALRAAILGVEGVNDVNIFDWNDFDILSGWEPGLMKIVIDSDDNSTVPLGEEVVVGPNTLNKTIQIRVWNAIKDDVRAAGIGVIFEQTELVYVDVRLNVILDYLADDNLKTQTLSLDDFKSIMKSRLIIYFNSLVVNEDVRWSQILKLGMNIAGVVAVKEVALQLSPAVVFQADYTDGVLSGNKKAVFNSLTVNGVLVP